MHPNLSPELQRAIQDVEGNNGFKLEDLERGTLVELRTRSGSLYTMVVINPTAHEVALFGGRHPETKEPDLYLFQGSTFGGSVTKVGWIVVGMRPKFNLLRGGLLVATAIKNFTLVNDPERAEKIIAEAEAKRPEPATEQDIEVWKAKVEEVIRGFGAEHATMFENSWLSSAR